jgi:hypothetical protein
VSVLLKALVDDAGLFPPASLPMDRALARHQADTRAGSPVLTHRFLCPASRLGELRAALDDEPVRLGLILDTGLDGLDAVLAGTSGDSRLRLELAEVPLGTGDQAALARAALAALAGVAVPAFLEPAPGPGALAAISVIAGHAAGAGASGPAGVARPAAAGNGAVRGAKVRCGGLTAAAFPAPSVLAAFLLACVAADVPVKATAGLHHAVRHADPGTGFTHYGFLNLLVAVAQAVQGAPAEPVEAALTCEESTWLTAQAGQMPAGVARRAREIFVSYGSCSTAEPAEEVTALGLTPAAGPESGEDSA